MLVGCDFVKLTDEPPHLMWSEEGKKDCCDTLYREEISTTLAHQHKSKDEQQVVGSRELQTVAFNKSKHD